MENGYKFKVGCVYANGWYVKTGKGYDTGGFTEKDIYVTGKFEVVARTAKTITLKAVPEYDDEDELFFRKRIVIDKNGNEVVFPLNKNCDNDWATVVKAEYLIEE